MPDIVIKTPDCAAVAAAAGPLVRQATALAVNDAPSYSAAVELLTEWRIRRRWIETELLGPAIEHAHRAHKSLTTLRAKLTGPYEEAEQIVQRRALTWRQDEERRAAQQAREREAEQRRLEDERRLSEAQAAQDSGQPELADAILEAPAAPVVIEAAPDVPAIPGVSRRRAPMRAELVDLRVLARWASDQPDPAPFVLANMPALSALARAGAPMPPGTRAVAGAETLAVRGIADEDVF